MSDFFLGARAMPWWLGGLSLAATTFAVDTPLAVTELTRSQGIAGNWLWWNMLLGGTLTTFFFARLWHRANILTDIELIALRYSGKAVIFLRGIKAFYFGFLINLLILAWVNLAMASVLEGGLGLAPPQALGGVAFLMIFTALYTLFSGLGGVMANDALQFVLAMVGSILLAYYVLKDPAIGGIENLVQKLNSSGVLNFFPTLSTENLVLEPVAQLSWGAFIAYMVVQWWASWYPGAEPGGGGYVAQRIMATPNEQQAWASALLFQFLHYAIRPWPWILVALATLILYPNAGAEEAKKTFVYAMRDYLPAGALGLMLVAFFSAYMSTISTHLNWGSSYIVNDLIAPWIANKPLSERQLLRIGQWLTIGMGVLSLLITPLLSSLKEAWMLVIESGAGIGLVLIARWYWWRVNVWSEIVAMIVPPLCYLLRQGIATLYFGGNNTLPFWLQFPTAFFATVAITTGAWVLVTFLTPVTSPKQLQEFYSKVQPLGFWGPFSHHLLREEIKILVQLFATYIMASLWLYTWVLGIGYLLLGFYTQLSYCLVLWLISGIALGLLFSKVEKKILQRQAKAKG
ncbi:MAG: sodium:solute symporter family protein [Bacteroidia bacterium]|nr:Na+:solute symporter [Bacteroidia bacterium]MDW8158666.1 sodium:solute symporter family protein [Bacteroidia bacterium]